MPGIHQKSRRWSHQVTTDALTLEREIFTWDDPKKIAKSLQVSAEKSTSRKGTPYQSAMSMLNFYINRAGKNLRIQQKKILQQAKIELRALYNK